MLSSLYGGGKRESIIGFRKFFARLINWGISDKSSTLDVIRCKIINGLNFLKISFISLLLVYRIYLGTEPIAIAVNSTLFLILSGCIYMCYKGKHQWSINVLAIAILCLSVDLALHNRFTSALIYWTISPTIFALLFGKKIKKHLFCLNCLFLFYLLSDGQSLDLNNYITFTGTLFISYLGMIGFVDFLEKKQVEIKKALLDKERAIVKLEQKNQDLRQFSHICSHDLKEPIRNIGCYSSLIQRKIAHEELEENYANYFSFIDTGVKSMSSILESLRIFTEINQEESFRPQKLHMDDILEKTQKNLSNLIQERNARIFVEKEVEDLELYSSPDALNLIFQNLIQNGIKYNKSAIPQIQIGQKTSEQDITFEVKDNGIGVEEKYLDYIFEAFKTIESKSSNNSSGLGLSICKGIAEKIGGEIWAESEAGKGSSFFIRLPRQKERALKAYG